MIDEEFSKNSIAEDKNDGVLHVVNALHAFEFFEIFVRPVRKVCKEIIDSLLVVFFISDFFFAE